MIGPAPPEEEEDGQFRLDLDGFEGPIDLLLSLARDQKADLSRISILALADQYLLYVERARRIRLELAADYLVMAAWLAWLKSRLLLPPEEVPEDEPSGAEMAEALAFQLKRLEAMQRAAGWLMRRPMLGRDVHARGQVEILGEVREKPVWEAGYVDLLAAYAAIRRRGQGESLEIVATELWSIEEALDRLSAMLGALPDWTTLESFLPAPGSTLLARSQLAATFLASLELARRGALELRQDGAFTPIFLRQAGS